MPELSPKRITYGSNLDNGLITAREGAKQVGYIYCDFKLPVTRIIGIGVDDEKQGRGIGSHLTALAEEIAIRLHATSISTISSEEGGFERILIKRGYTKLGSQFTKSLK